MQPIFVGDVQGCAEELGELLERARAGFGEAFELWLVGDLVNRGPSNLEPLRRIRELVDAGRARYVLGNHELALLLTAAGLRAPRPYDTFGDVLGAADAADWLEWLRRRPLVVTGRLGAQRFAMAHAAVHPDWDLETLAARARRIEARLGAPAWSDALALLAADPRCDEDRDLLGRLTQCRSVTRAGAWSAELPGGELEPWHRAWSARAHGYGVVYGHWAMQGLHVAPWLRGLDTGCVHHGRGRGGLLTAWLPDPSARTPFDVPDERFWQVPARRVYYAARLAPDEDRQIPIAGSEPRA
jgi:bis(5'-nucleosyl)-tetraphosphatase (symmetrical)